MTNKEIIEEYFSLFELRGRSQLTINNYGYAFNEFFRMINNKHYLEITTRDIRGYLKDKKETVKQTTLKNKITIIKTFFKWLKEEGYREDDPAKRIQKPTVNDNERRHLKPEEIEIIRLEIDDLFDITMFELFLSSGLRVSELTDLNWFNIDFHDREINVLHGKGDKARITKFSIKAKLLLEKYRETREDNDEWVFQSRYKQRISTESVQRHIKNLGKKVNLPIRLTPHKLRHTFATILARKGTPIEVIQELMGHSDINTTRRYIEVDKSNIDYQFNQAFA